MEIPQQMYIQRQVFPLKGVKLIVILGIVYSV